MKPAPSAMIASAVFITGVAAFVILAVRTALGWADAFSAGLQLPALAASLGVYLMAHAARAIRLCAIVVRNDVSLSHVILAQFYSAGLALFIPFKLGEIYRIHELAVALGTVRRAVAAVWMERAFDVAAILGLIGFVAVAGGTVSTAMAPLIGVALLFVLFSLAAALVFPPVLSMIKMCLIKRYDHTVAIHGVAQLHRLQGFLTETAQMIGGHRLVFIGLATALIWVLEVAALGLLLPALETDPVRLLSGLGAMLSSVLVDADFLLGVSPPPAAETSDLGSAKALRHMPLVLQIGLIGLGCAALPGLVRRRLAGRKMLSWLSPRRV